jgi:Na+-translocating ferredoxin:NAD+ oxidoreductase RnfC subunit
MWTKERFETFFKQSDGCWLWEGSLRGKGYGGYKENGKMHIASRVSYELYKEPIPQGVLVCHKCNTPSCVNPSHLYLGTYSDNTQQAVEEGRQFVAKGELNGSSKLTEEQVIQIRCDTRSQRAIAKDFNISQLHVSRIKRNLVWKDLNCTN